jgi:hypothetical protein
MKGSKSSTLKVTQENSPAKKRKRLENIKINLQNCKYEVVKRIACEKKYGFGWKMEVQSAEVTSPGKIDN